MIEKSKILDIFAGIGSVSEEFDKFGPKKIVMIEGSLQSKERDVPEYIQTDNKNKTVKLVRIPKFSEVPYPIVMEPNLVIEYYSR